VLRESIPIILGLNNNAISYGLTRLEIDWHKQIPTSLPTKERVVVLEH
jgi:hypothetical protein